MNRSDLKVIIGGLDLRKRSEEKRYISGFTTDSRLMGVLVIYLRWELGSYYSTDEDDRSFHQFFYIETTEVGIESYRSLYGNDAVAMLEIEQAMLGGLGSEKIDITEREARILLQEYAGYNKRFGEELPEGEDEYGFLLTEAVDSTPAEREALFRKTCVRLGNGNQLINYFLMRYFGGDVDAVRILAGDQIASTLSRDTYCDTLCLNRIEKLPGKGEEAAYLCESLIESDTAHRIVTSEIHTTGSRVSSFEVLSAFRISAAETAMKLERPEFVTVYEVQADSVRLEEFLDNRYMSAMKRDTEAGRLYLNFNENNNHLKEAVYRLNDDVKGMVYLTDDGQLVLATYSLARIHRLEREIQASPFAHKLSAIAKYEFKEDVFYDFVRSETGDFIHFVEYLCDFDPEDE
ncbi:MAG: hypothetical protein LBR14_00845 [Clostridiales Family XIII bacterium]|jgi:hypothetical protein|nr:hypothetical protein [Clostridiales Family XIII bacterium]